MFNEKVFFRYDTGKVVRLVCFCEQLIKMIDLVSEAFGERQLQLLEVAGKCWIRG